jgi:hypothetical protein
MALPLYGYNPYQFGQVNPLQPQMDRLANMQAQYQQPQQQNVNQGILWVQGEAGAKSYLVAPNTSVLLMDSENSQFYIKTTDQAGMPTLRTFVYQEVTGSYQNAQKQPETNLDDKYVTRQEYNDLRGKYEESYMFLETATKPTGKDE